MKYPMFWVAFLCTTLFLEWIFTLSFTTLWPSHRWLDLVPGKTVLVLSWDNNILFRKNMYSKHKDYSICMAYPGAGRIYICALAYWLEFCKKTEVTRKKKKDRRDNKDLRGKNIFVFIFHFHLGSLSSVYTCSIKCHRNLTVWMFKWLGYRS